MDLKYLLSVNAEPYYNDKLDKVISFKIGNIPFRIESNGDGYKRVNHQVVKVDKVLDSNKFDLYWDELEYTKDSGYWRF